MSSGWPGKLPRWGVSPRWEEGARAWVNPASSPTIAASPVTWPKNILTQIYLDLSYVTLFHSSYVVLYEAHICNIIPLWFFHKNIIRKRKNLRISEYFQWLSTFSESWKDLRYPYFFLEIHSNFVLCFLVSVLHLDFGPGGIIIYTGFESSASDK